jgi:hypothetical protein
MKQTIFAKRIVYADGNPARELVVVDQTGIHTPGWVLPPENLLAMARVCLHLYQRSVVDQPRNIGALLDALEHDALGGELCWPMEALETSGVLSAGMLTERAEINALLAKPVTTGEPATK